jgi:FtsP/CotA-like multicopper oxidase with cupredoxin domain
LGALLGAGTVVGLGACTRSATPAAISVPVTNTGKTRDLRLRARSFDVDLAGRAVTTWGYGGTIPGAPIRVTAGDRVRITVTNDLPVDTSVHWHGLRIDNAMDGVPGLTTPAVGSGDTFVYDFAVPDPGTHWFHPHSGLQLDTGLYAPFIVDDPQDPGDYDQEWVVVLDDWTDGVGPSPDEIYAALVAAGERSPDGMTMGGMDHMPMGQGAMMSGTGGDVDYPVFVINGRAPEDPDVLRAKPRDRVRIRIINAGADTVFTVALADHELQVTHTDGNPVQPTSTTSLQIGMGERYDVVVTLKSGAFTLAAEAVGKSGRAQAVIRTASDRLSGERPSELDSYPMTAESLQSVESARLAARTPDSVQQVVLSGSMAPYVWTINGEPYDRTEPLRMESGELVRLRLTNMSMMPHPVHLHGHRFQVGSAGSSGAVKDTLLLPPMAAVDVDLLADNPGRWLLHCHNAYHMEAGMMTRLEYT